MLRDRPFKFIHFEIIHGRIPKMQPTIQETELRAEAVTYVTQSRFFSPAFNAAIFDGPIRIYFAQFQEAQALKLYFNLQERFSDVRKQARGIFKERGQNIFVMMYPNEDTFDLSFSGDLKTDPKPTGLGAEAGVGTQIVRTRLGADYVVGVRGPLEDEDLESLCREMDQIVSSPQD
jgi:hypothetical protein